jgi:hypothetical protein
MQGDLRKKRKDLKQSAQTSLELSTFCCAPMRAKAGNFVTSRNFSYPPTDCLVPI